MACKGVIHVSAEKPGFVALGLSDSNSANNLLALFCSDAQFAV